MIKQSGAKSVVLLQNFAYNDKSYFHNADLIIVPSQYSAREYQKRLGLVTTVIPPIINWSNVTRSSEKEGAKGDFVLFVNPSEQKGIYLFVKIVKVLWKKRPDIAFLVVDGSSDSHKLGQFRNILFDVGSLRSVKNTTNPSLFYAESKIALVPSVFEESFGRKGWRRVVNSRRTRDWFDTGSVAGNSWRRGNTSRYSRIYHAGYKNNPNGNRSPTLGRRSHKIVGRRISSKTNDSKGQSACACFMGKKPNRRFI